MLVADSVLGAWLLRHQGARAWRAFRQALEEGRWPGDEVAQGALVIIGGTLLLTPGFITDVIGFLLLIPISRRLVAGTLRSRIRTQVVGGPGDDPRRADPRRTRPGRRPGSAQGVFDVEVVEVRREYNAPAPGPAELSNEGRDDAGDGGEQRRDDDAGDGRDEGDGGERRGGDERRDDAAGDDRDGCDGHDAGDSDERRGGDERRDDDAGDGRNAGDGGEWRGDDAGDDDPLSRQPDDER